MIKYHSNLSFVDMLFGSILALLFMIMLLSPITQDSGKVDPPTEILLELDWNPESNADMDMWLLLPNGEKVSYLNKDRKYAILQRDDLGSLNDTYTGKGAEEGIKRRGEINQIMAAVAGRCVVSVDAFGAKPGDDREVRVDIMDFRPVELVFTHSAVVPLKQERTLSSFRVTREGKLVDVRTEGVPVRGNALGVP